MGDHFQNVFLIEGPLAQSSVNVDLISGVTSGAQDVSGWGFGSVQIVASSGISSGAVTFECSNDGVTYATLAVQETAALLGAGTLITAATTIAASTSRVFYFVIPTKFVRCRISTAFVGGTVAAVTILRQDAPVQLVQQVRNSALASHFLVTTTPTSGTTHTLNAAATTNATSVKASAGALFTLSLSNLSGSTKFFKLYAKASAPTVGTDVPILTIPVAATSAVSYEFGAVGQQISTGIAYALTGAMADSDTTALASGDMKVALTYI